MWHRIDDLGFNDISYRGTSDLSSPNIDKMALQGIRLERYVSAATVGSGRDLLPP